jgi:hypothetical protein
MGPLPSDSGPWVRLCLPVEVVRLEMQRSKPSPISLQLVQMLDNPDRNMKKFVFTVQSGL